MWCFVVFLIPLPSKKCLLSWCRGQLKCDGTRAETRFRFSAKQMSPFKSAGASVQSTTGSRGVSISSSNAGYTMFRGSVKSTGYPLHSSVSPALPLPCVTVCHQTSTVVYCGFMWLFTGCIGGCCEYGNEYFEYQVRLRNFWLKKLNVAWLQYAHLASFNTAYCLLYVSVLICFH